MTGQKAAWREIKAFSPGLLRAGPIQNRYIDADRFHRLSNATVDNSCDTTVGGWNPCPQSPRGIVGQNPPVWPAGQPGYQILCQSFSQIFQTCFLTWHPKNTHQNIRRLLRLPLNWRGRRLCDKAIAASMNGAHKLTLVPGIAQGAAQRFDRARYRPVIDRTALPDCFDKVFAADDTAPVTDQKTWEQKALGFDGDRVAVSQQLGCRFVIYECTKAPDTGVCAAQKSDPPVILPKPPSPAQASCPKSV